MLLKRGVTELLWKSKPINCTTPQLKSWNIFFGNYLNELYVIVHEKWWDTSYCKRHLRNGNSSCCALLFIFFLMSPLLNSKGNETFFDNTGIKKNNEAL